MIRQLLTKEFNQILLLAAILIVSNSIAIKFFGNYYIFFALGTMFLSALVIYYFYFFNDIVIFSIVIFSFQFVYLNNSFHYSENIEFLSAIPLYFIIVIYIYDVIRKNKFELTGFSYIKLPVFCVVIYASISALIGFISGYKTEMIIYEYFHFLYYLMIFPLSYFIKKDNSFKQIFYFLFILSILISLQYIILAFVFNVPRFVTFQSGFIPLVIGVIFAQILIQKANLWRVISLFILLLGIFVTLTRSLWVTSILVLFAVLYFHLFVKNRVLKFIIPIIFLILSLFYIANIDYTSGLKVVHAKVNKSVEYRVNTLANPAEDASFLMRMELGYYVINKFLDSPIFGKGFGDWVKYQFLVPTQEPNYYPDSVWLYVLWKGGLIGFILFSWMYFRVIKALYFIYKVSLNDKNFYLSSNSLGLFIGLFFLVLLGLLSPILIKYKTNFILILIITYSDYYYEKFKDSCNKKQLN